MNLDLRVYNDGYKKCEALIEPEMKEGPQRYKEMRPKKLEAKSMMEAFRATAESLKRGVSWDVSDSPSLQASSIPVLPHQQVAS